jgi:hypothetical protein
MFDDRYTLANDVVTEDLSSNERVIVGSWNVEVGTARALGICTATHESNRIIKNSHQ